MVREEWRLEGDEWVVDPGTAVVAVDGSGKDANALLWAATDAARHGSDLVVVTVVDDGLLVSLHASLVAWRPYAEEVLDRAVWQVEHLLPEDRLHRLVLAGDPAVELTRRFPQVRAVVVGRRGAGALERVMVGSTSLGVVARSRVPVVVVPDGWDPARTGRRPVVVGVDPGGAEEHMLALASGAAERLGVPLVAVHALDVRRVPVGAHGGEEGADHRHDAFDVLLDTWSSVAPTTEVQRVRSSGAAATAILDAASDAQLVVLGRCRRTALPGILLGSTLRAVLHYADCPVMVVPDPPEGEDR
ncbi:MAG TPA: universal stress protein [Marmoricola sp.]|nr:universal stress protein [Marmoricola sp.]